VGSGEGIMLPVKANYIVDKKGNPVSVVLPKKEYERLLLYIEELEDIAAYDRAKREKGPVKPWASVKK
jgi:hypothetical protein